MDTRYRLGISVPHKRLFFFFSSRRRHTRLQGDWSSDVCSSDLRSCLNFLWELRSAVDEHDDVAEVSAGEVVAAPASMKRFDLRCEQVRRGHGEIGRASCRERV